MATLSDLIELHLHCLVDEAKGRHIEIIRSELAGRFNCVPSQINYVLSTRFTPARGFLVESQRGSGGHVRIRRIYLGEGSSLHEYLLTETATELTQEQARHICERLLHERMVNEREAALMIAATRRSSIPLHLPLRDQIRATVLRAMLMEIARRTDTGEE